MMWRWRRLVRVAALSKKWISLKFSEVSFKLRDTIFSIPEMVVPEVNQQLFAKLEEMGFPKERATRALHFSGMLSWKHRFVIYSVDPFFGILYYYCMMKMIINRMDKCIPVQCSWFLSFRLFPLDKCLGVWFSF